MGENVQIKNDANSFLLRKTISFPFHSLGSSYALKPAKSVIIMYTSQNNKALHHAVGSPMNPRRMVVLSHLKLSAVTINLTFLFFVRLLVFSVNSWKILQSNQVKRSRR